MNALLNVPLELRLLTLFVLGTIVGSVLNLATYRLAWQVRHFSPWTPGLSGQANWGDRIPVVGWLRWRRRGGEWGRNFWIRPLLVELLTGMAFAGLYGWEIGQQGLLPAGGLAVAAMPDGVWPCPTGVVGQLHLTYGSHLILLALMIVASLIDLDDRVIPDTVTVPGTLAGLTLATIVPWSLLPNVVISIGGPPVGAVIDFLKLTSPHFWPARLGLGPQSGPLWLGLACYWGWCFALLPRHLRLRHGWRRAWQIFTARLVREPFTRLVIFLAVTGSLAIYVVWRIGGVHWAGMLTALVGMAASGGLIWVVRIIGTVVLGREAMGFGDVTLMALIGTFVGWQSSIIIFFVAPLFAVAIGIGHWILRRDPEIPYGPFLCLGTSAVIWCWAAVWDWAYPLFHLTGLVPAVMAMCMVLMAVLLGGMRLMRRLF